MSDFSIYTKEEQLENLKEDAVDSDYLHDVLFHMLKLLKENFIKCIENTFNTSMQDINPMLSGYYKIVSKNKEKDQET